MSFFDWNLSSDEEDRFDEDCNSSVQQNVLGRNQQNDDNDDDESDDSDIESEIKRPATVAFFSEDEPEQAMEEEEDGDDEEIDWEDGEEEEDEDKKLSSDTAATAVASAMNHHRPLKAVTLEWNGPNSKVSKETSKRKRIARKSYRFDRLPPDLQRFLTDLEKSHLLCYTAHALMASKYCSNEEVLHVSHSLIPLAWSQNNNKSSSKAASNKNVPSIQDLNHFCNFFFTLIRRRPSIVPPSRYARRKKTKGKESKTTTSGKPKRSDASTIFYRTVEYCSYLSNQMQNLDHNEGSQQIETTRYNYHDAVHLLIAMARSLGWRARFVVAFEPSKKDLDVNHPLFVAMSTRNVFQRIWKENQQNLNQKKPAKRPKTTKSDTTGETVNRLKSLPIPSSFTPIMQQTESGTLCPICWVEILCETKPAKNSKPPPPQGAPASASSSLATENAERHSPKLNWICVDPRFELVNKPKMVESVLYSQQNNVPFKTVNRKVPITYALAAEHIPFGNSTVATRLVDVTPRYASSWTDSLKMRGVLRGKQTRVKDSERVDKWWSSVLKSINSGEKHRRDNLRSLLMKFKGTSAQDAIVLDDDNNSTNEKESSSNENLTGSDTLKEADDHEAKELEESRKNEPIPTSKTGFKSHPIYVIPSVLNANEVLVPDAKKRICGIFKGELVFRRTDVESALPLKRWLYRGRKVKKAEIKKPIKRVKARKKATKGFKALKSYGVGTDNDGGEEYKLKQIGTATKPLEDGMENLYASWQTDPWSPSPVGPSDPIPVNEHNNIEVELLNPGLVHIDLQRVSKLAKQLGIPYAPCLLGFEGHGGNRTPTISGIVVHQHNEELLREAHVEMASNLLEQENENRQQMIIKKWKRLLVGILVKDRLDRAYGGSTS